MCGVVVQWLYTPIPDGIASPGADLFSELPLPSGKLLRKMLDCHGVPWDALYNVRKGWVRFDDDGFDLEVGGTPAFILPCRDGDKIVDLAAWAGDQLATWKLTPAPAFCLGDLGEIFNPATYFAGGGLRIHRGAREWLRAGCEGIVILRPKLCYPYLKHAPRVVCSDEEVGAPRAQAQQGADARHPYFCRKHFA